MPRSFTDRGYPRSRQNRPCKGIGKTQEEALTKLSKSIASHVAKQLQENLNKLGCSLKLDGVFGFNTLHEVQKFQLKNNLTVDGSIGKMTIQALNKVNEQKLWDRLVKDRFDFLDDIVKTNLDSSDTSYKNKVLIKL